RSNRMARLTRIGQAAFEMNSGSVIDEPLDDPIPLEESGWKRDAGTPISTAPRSRDFYARLANRLAARGWLRLMFLTASGRRIATSYSIQYRGRLFLCKT